MRMDACRYEPAAVEAVMLGQWPSRVDDDLRQHVTGCETCRQAVSLAEAFEADAAALHVQAGRRLPDGRLVWWRAQVQARQAARRVALQPIVAAVALAAVAGLVTTVGLAGVMVAVVGEWAGRVVGLALAASTSLADVPASVTSLAFAYLPILAGVVTTLLLVPVACYLVLRQE